MSAIPTTPESKLWELLRRNHCFRKSVARLQVLDAQARRADTADGSRWVGERMVDRFDKLNRFAAEALRWLVPNPLFLHRKIVLPSDFKSTDTVVTRETIRLGRNASPQPENGKNWQWFDSVGELSADSVASISGRPMRWGPTIEKVVTDEPLLKHLCHDEIAEWNNYFARRNFDVDTSWEESPPHFQRAFKGLWSQLLGDTFGVHETNFFQGRNPATGLINATKVVKAANECISSLVNDLSRVARGEAETVCPPIPTKGGASVREKPQFVFSPSEDDQAKMFQFEDLARKRVFVVPHVLRRSDAKRIVKVFHQQLIAGLPDDRDLLGTKNFWETAIGVELLEKELGLDGSAALGHYVRQKWGRSAVQAQFRGARKTLNRWFKNEVLLPAPPKQQKRDYAEWQTVKTTINPIFRNVDRNYRRTVKARVEFICKLSAATFPRLKLEVLTALPPHKAKKSK